MKSLLVIVSKAMLYSISLTRVRTKGGHYMVGLFVITNQLMFVLSEINA